MSKKTGRKLGAISTAEAKYLVEHHRNMTFEEMAEELNRTPEFCKKYIIDKGLYAEPTKEESEDKARCIRILHDMAFWPGLVAAYENDELIYFENNWYSIYKQLNEDVSYTEHLYIKDWISLEIEKNRLLAKQKEINQSIKQLRKDIELEEKVDPSAANIVLQSKKQELAVREASVSQYIPMLEKLNKDIKNYANGIKANRDQRRQVENSADTYWGYVAMLDDEKFRSKEGHRAELGKLAQQKSLELLSGWHEYHDATVDIPILNADTLSKKINEEENE